MVWRFPSCFESCSSRFRAAPGSKNCGRLDLVRLPLTLCTRFSKRVGIKSDTNVTSVHCAAAIDSEQGGLV